MNIFVIPSWYPSEDYPVNGIMIKEQFEAICRLYPAVNVGISLWGQQNEKLLLYAKDHFKNLHKIANASSDSSTYEVLPNLKEYTTPAFTWSQKVAHGNRRGIVKANLKNLKMFEAEFGPAQIIHAQAGQPAAPITMEVARRASLPYVITERMGPFPSIYATDKKGRLTPMYLQAYQHAKATIAVSPFLANTMETYGINKVEVIPDFTNEHYFEPKEPSLNNTFTFFSLGRIEPLKGMQELVEAMKLVSKQHEVKLRIGGAGSQAVELKQLTKDYGLGNRIAWLGDLSRAQILEEFQQCHAFVLASHYEAFGISFIEALACGKPVIATKCGGPESIVNEINGLLAEIINPEDLATKMIELVENYKNYSSSKIRQDLLIRFSSQAVAPQIITFYENLINHENSTHRYR